MKRLTLSSLALLAMSTFASAATLSETEIAQVMAAVPDANLTNLTNLSDEQVATIQGALNNGDGNMLAAAIRSALDTDAVPAATVVISTENTLSENEQHDSLTLIPDADLNNLDVEQIVALQSALSSSDTSNRGAAIRAVLN